MRIDLILQFYPNYYYELYLVWDIVQKAYMYRYCIDPMKYTNIHQDEETGWRPGTWFHSRDMATRSEHGITGGTRQHGLMAGTQ